MPNDKIEVVIIPEDFKNAPRGFQNIHEMPGIGCVLWQALHRKFPKDVVTVWSTHAIIDGERYEIPDTWGSTFMIEGHYHPSVIELLSEQAKESLKGIPTISLTLTAH